MQVHIHPSIQRFAQGVALLDIHANQVDQIVQAIIDTAPGLQSCLINSDGETQPYINIYINGRSISKFSDHQSLSSDDKIEVLTSLVGG